MIIGRGGAGIEALKKDIEAFLGRPANINIMEIKVPDTNALPVSYTHLDVYKRQGL